MSERIQYENKLFAAPNTISKLKNPQISSNASNYASKFIIDPHQIPKNMSQSSQKKISFTALNKNDIKIIPQAHNQHQFQPSDNYQMKHITQHLGQGSTQLHMNESSKLKKARRLRKNFDVLQQALKISSTSKRDKKINFSSDSRNVQHNNSQNIPLQKQNYLVSDSPSSFTKITKMQNESINEMYQYGGVTQQQSFKDRKSSCYEVFGHYNAPQKTQQQSSVHNLSLYSQISLKDGNTPEKNKKSNAPQQSRNQNQMIYANLPQHNTQPMIMLSNEQRSFMKVNDKLMRKYVALTQGGVQLTEDQNRSNSQAILNISTASDINIYNNSFILNTSGKKLPQSQNQSRSNSLRRNQNYQGSSQQKIAKIPPGVNYRVHSSSGRASNASNLSNVTKLSNTGQVSKDNNKGQKYIAIAEAYNTNILKNTNAYQVGGVGGGSWQQQVQKGVMGSSQRSFQNSRNSFEVASGMMHSENNIKRFENIEQLITSSQKKPKLRNASNSSRRKQENELQDVPDYSPIQTNGLEQQKSAILTKQGKQKLLNRDYQGAISSFSDALSLDHKNIDAKFYRCLSYLDSGLLKEAIVELNQVLTLSQDHAQITYVLLSIAYKRNNNIQKSIKILSECIDKHPSYPDAYLARGQACLIQEKYDLALSDFNKYTQIVPNHGVGHIGIGDSQKALKNWNESIQAYSNAINIITKLPKDSSQEYQHLVSAYMKRGIASYNSKKFQQALKDFQYVLSKDKTQAKVHFYIGKILSKDGSQKQNDAILHFEQVVKHQHNEIYAGSALFEIAKLRLKEKDFYEAYFNLKRALDSNFTSKRMQLYKDFTEGVLYLIKRKIKKGVQILSDLLEILVNNKEQKDKKMIDYLKHQVYIYRAYGYVAIEKYEVAIDDIKKSKKYGKVCLASVYNKLLGKGILRMDHEDFLMATKYFNKASYKFTGNKDPYCLYVISIVRSYSYSLKGVSIDQEEKKKKVMDTKDFMDRAIKNCNKTKEPSLYFFRGLLNFQLHYFYEALQDFNQAIDEEEEPTASYYLARGRCYACLSILTEAMKDLSIALNLDDTLQEAYIYRGKCAYLLGDNNLAFLDFQRLILTDPKNPMVHVYAGNLLMTTGAYQDAIKAFLNADTVQQTALAAFQRARCYCALTELENASKEMSTALSLVETESLSYFDSNIISHLINAANSFQDPKNQKKVLSNAISGINKSIDSFEQGLVKSLTRKESPLNIQIIPNVKRIKVEKVAVAKELIAQQTDQKEMSSLSIDVNQSVDLDALKDIPMFSYYYENVFQLEDFYLFRAVFSFYMQEYDNAAHDFKMCSHLRHESEKKGGYENKQNQTMVVYNQSRGSTPMLSMHSSKTDLSDVGLCSLNVHETNYNMLLCYLMMQDKERSLEKVNEIIVQAPKKYQKHFYLVRALMYEQWNERDKFEKDLRRFEKQEPKAYGQFFKENKEFSFEPFPIKNRLCNLFGNIQLKLGIKRPVINAKLSFSMPFIKPPNMIPNIDEDIIQEEFNLKQIDAPMPEAPWIRRWQNGIKFTDEMQEEDIDLNTGDEKQVPTQKSSKQSQRRAKIGKKDSDYKQEGIPLSAKKKHLSEQILQQAMVYLVDQEEELSDKHKISLFDESKFEDNTIEKERGTDNKQIHSSEDYDDDDDDSSGEDNSNIYIKIGERDSMVLVGDNQLKAKKKTEEDFDEKPKKHFQGMRLSQDKKHSGHDQDEKMRVLSELESNIEGVEDDLIDRESLFRSRQSSIGGR